MNTTKTLAVTAAALSCLTLGAQPTMTDKRLGVRTVVEGLELPTSMAFLGPNDFFICEKNSGRVLRVVGGADRGAVLDLAVNGGSERGLLGITLHPNFSQNGFVYLYLTESTTGVDTTVLSETTLLGNRVDRFVWNGLTLSFDRNIARFRAIQRDAEQPERGNHNGGILEFGPDGKLYVIVGDVGRRGFLQNVLEGFGPNGMDDEFGGPEPDNAHFTGVIVRLNDDGTTPSDNPFFAYGASLGGEVGANLQKTFMYGIRNSFGMDVDRFSGGLWFQENGEDAFDELNLAEAGANGGWIQIMGPASRVAQYREIEMTSLHHETFPNLQQIRWPPKLIAETPEDALSRLYTIPGSFFSDPEFAWKYVLAPAAIGFVHGRGLGKDYIGDLLMGFSTLDTLNGPLFRFNLTGNR